jgi:hypothetical protein
MRLIFAPFHRAGNLLAEGAAFQGFCGSLANVILLNATVGAASEGEQQGLVPITVQTLGYHFARGFDPRAAEGGELLCISLSGHIASRMRVEDAIPVIDSAPPETNAPPWLLSRFALLSSRAD